MLAFLEHLADRVEGVPLLVVGTARPELFERRADYAARLRNATHINLMPLSEEETARLVSALLKTAVIPAELQQPILVRAGGNPLYAEEFVRLLKDKDLLIKRGGSWILDEGAQVPFPDSVQALIAARLDTLPADTKSMFADAAVIGKVFWAGAIAAMGDRDPAQVTETLRVLSRKELVRPARRSSIEGDAEYAFWHVLARDVAYGQLPRASRASRHVAAARWIESMAAERIKDLADGLAYHYATALELARAAGQIELATELEAPALKFLSLAGERATGLDTAAALSNLERALALTPPGHPERAQALCRFGKAAFQAARYAEAAGSLEEASASFRAAGDLPAAASTMAQLSSLFMRLGDPRRRTLAAEALVVLEPLGPSLELVDALALMASVESLQGNFVKGAQLAERAITLAEELGSPRHAGALNTRGAIRATLGDPGGLEDYREAIELANGAGLGRVAVLSYNNLGVDLLGFEGPTASLEVLRQGITYAKARGLTEAADSLTQSTLDSLLDAGETERALGIVAEVVPLLEAGGDVFNLVWARGVQTRIVQMQGRAEEVEDTLDWLELTARGIEEPQIVVYGLGSAALAHAALGQIERVATLIDELQSFAGSRDTTAYSALLPSLVRTALGIDEIALADRLVAGLHPPYPYAGHALVAANAALAEASGKLEVAADAYADAADRWQRFGVVPEQAFAFLGQGRCLLGLSRPTEAEPLLQHARVIFERLEAVPRSSRPTPSWSKRRAQLLGHRSVRRQGCPRPRAHGSLHNASRNNAAALRGTHRYSTTQRFRRSTP